MATKLKNIHLTKVDFVDEGANQRADIKLTKSKDPEEGSPNPDIDEKKGAGLFKRFIAWLRGEGLSLEDVEKAATSFDQQINAASVEDITEEIWSVTYALRNSLDSIVYDMELAATDKATAMNESLTQFTAAMQDYIPIWSAGQEAKIKKGFEKPDESELSVMKRDHRFLGEMIEKAKETKGELEEMLKIDKSKMTPEELAAYEEITKKYAVEVEEPENVEKSAGAEKEELLDEGEKVETAKSVSGQQTEQKADGAETLIADLRAEVAKLKDDALTRELTAVAKKYEVLGKKPEDLVPTLKSLMAAGGTAYDNMIATLDDLVAAQEASGIFSEIGKSRGGSAGGRFESESKIEGIAKGLMEKDPTLSPAAALAKAWESNPELMAEYETEAGF